MQIVIIHLVIFASIALGIVLSTIAVGAWRSLSSSLALKDSRSALQR